MDKHSEKLRSAGASLAATLRLSDWSRRQLLSTLKARYPAASARILEERAYRYLARIEEVRERSRYRVR
jgi:hypothetical protein